jgi:hypothetical protein
MDKSSFFPPRPPRPTNEAEWIYYTVEDAERILAHLNEGNRRLDAGNVSLLVRAHDRTACPRTARA